MDISGEYEIPAPRAAVWDALNDPAVLQRCIPGCESIEQSSATEMQAQVTAAIGPVKARFKTSIELQKLNPPVSYTLAGEAKAGAAGFGRGSADVELEETGAAATRLRYTADFKVGGKLAQVGSRLVLGATRKTADEFFGNLARELGAADTRPADAAAEAPGSLRRYGAIGAVLAILLILWFLLG
jgi:uncharacterized protein